MAAHRSTPEALDADRSAVSDTLWRLPEQAAEEARRNAPPEQADEAARKAFNEARRAGWDRFARICEHIEWLEEQLAKKGGGR